VHFLRDKLKKLKKEALFVYIGLGLFFVPFVYFTGFSNSFVRGKEMFIYCYLLFGIGLFFLKLITDKSRQISINNVFSSPVFIIICSILLLSLIVSITTPTPGINFWGTFIRGGGVLYWIILFLYVSFIGLFAERKISENFLFFPIISGTIVSIYGIIQFLGFDFLFSNFNTKFFDGRVFSFLGNPAYLGQFLTLILIPVLYFIFKNLSLKNWKKESIFIALFLLIFYVIVLTQTRTAMVGIVFLFFFLTVKNLKRIYKYCVKNKFFILFPVLIVAISIIGVRSFSERFSFSDLATRSLNSRIEIWKGTIELVKERPFLGYGLENFQVYFPEVASKAFLSLEENININADRIHNESLEFLFSLGIVGLLLYLLLFIILSVGFFKEKESSYSYLYLIPLTNMVQNQFAFSDASIIFLVVSILGILIARESKGKSSFRMKKYLFLLLIPLFLIIAKFKIFDAVMCELNYNKYSNSVGSSYSDAMYYLKEAQFYSPYYSELWYEMMMIDEISMKRALENIFKIEGKSGNYLAWMGNYFANFDPETASDYYIKALEKNPNNPNWLRAFGDMLCSYGDKESASIIYERYLNSIPEIWKWGNAYDTLTDSKKKTYDTFLKTTPYFPDLLKKIENCK
jgi:putative inorganic carbon (HCO3(-)) transporter